MFFVYMTHSFNVSVNTKCIFIFRKKLYFEMGNTDSLTPQKVLYHRRSPCSNQGGGLELVDLIPLFSLLKCHWKLLHSFFSMFTLSTNFNLPCLSPTSFFLPETRHCCSKVSGEDFIHLFRTASKNHFIEVFNTSS